MRIVRFCVDGKIRFGSQEGVYVVEYSGTPFSAFRRGRRRYPLRQVILLPPVQPSKIVGIGTNYRDRAAELGVGPFDEPAIFLKPISAIIGPDDPIVYPPQSEWVDYEAELAVVIRRRCRRVSATRALEHVLGYTCVNDVTARDLGRKDRQPIRAKAFDTFCPIGPCIATDIDPKASTIETWVNGERRQSSSTKEMILPVEDVVARVSEVMTLLPADVITTGTPAGAGPLHPGDHVEVRIEGIGHLRNMVVRL